MWQATPLSTPAASMPATTPLSRASTEYESEVETLQADSDKSNNYIDVCTECVALEEPLKLVCCVSRQSAFKTEEAERIPMQGKTGDSSSSRSCGPLTRADLPLSYSSHDLDSGACTDEVDEYDAGEDGEDDVRSVGSCAAHQVELTSSATKTRAASSAATPVRQDVHADPAVPRRHAFSSLATSTTSWGAMRKLRLENAHHGLTGVPGSTGAVAGGSNGASDKPQHDTQPPSTVANRVVFPPPSSHSAQRGNAAQVAAHDGEGCSIPTTTVAATDKAGCWSLAPRLRGVNEVLLSTAHSQLFREALDALPVWSTGVHLTLHHNSAGGTYMVRLASAAAAADTGARTSPAFARSPSANTVNEVVAVFKPRDEEIGQETNPHGNCESDRTDCFAPGSGSRREVLAYRLDHNHNAGVPPTVEVATGYTSHGAGGGGGGEDGVAALPGLSSGVSRGTSGLGGCAVREAEATPAGLSALSMRTVGTAGRCEGARRMRVAQSHAQTYEEHRNDNDRGASTLPQIGSMQLFLPGCQEAADVLPGRFDVDEVHALAIFDIRTLNGDRHGGNVLVQNYRGTRGSPSPPRERGRGSSSGGSQLQLPPHLIPIDHSYICPSGYADPDYEWLSWPQAKKPFSPSNLQYIAALDAEADAELVRCALLAQSASATTATATTAGGDDLSGDGGAVLFDLRTCMMHHEAGDIHAASLCASRTECASSQTTTALMLDDGVRHARAVAHECGVPLDVSPCGPSLASQCGVHRGDSFTDLTIFSPVRARAASEDGFGSPRGFSMTALPEPAAGSVAAGWAEATALLLDSEDDADSDDGAAAKEIQTQKMGLAGKVQSLAASDSHESCASPSLSFQTYDGSSTTHRTVVASAVTYDKGAANAAAELMRCTTRLLQIAALEYHLTAYAIGSLCRRPRVAQASFLEAVMEEARDEFSWEVVLHTFDALVRQRLSAGVVE